jgi:hypothetical protein
MISSLFLCTRAVCTCFCTLWCDKQQVCLRASLPGNVRSGRAKTARISSRISGVQNTTNDMTMFLAASAPAAAFSARAVCSQRYALGSIILRCVRANMRHHTFAARLCQRGFPKQSTFVSSSAGAAFVRNHFCFLVACVAQASYKPALHGATLSAVACLSRCASLNRLQAIASCKAAKRMRAHGRQHRLFVPAHGLYSLIHNANAPPPHRCWDWRAAAAAVGSSHLWNAQAQSQKHSDSVRRVEASFHSFPGVGCVSRGW